MPGRGAHTGAMLTSSRASRGFLSSATRRPAASMRPLQWEHRDPRGLAEAVRQASARAREPGGWDQDASTSSTGSRVADLRALAIATAYTRADLSLDRPIQGEGSSVRIPLDVGADVPDPDRARAIALLARTFDVLAGDDARAGAGSLVRSIRTDGDAAPADAGNLVAIVAIVAGLTATAVTVCWIAQKTSEIVDRQLARNADNARLAEAHARTLDVLSEHTKEEDKKGSVLPLTDAERAVLGGLGAVQSEILKKRETPLPGPNLPGVATGFSLGVVAAVGVAAWLVLQTTETHK